MSSGRGPTTLAEFGKDEEPLHQLQTREADLSEQLRPVGAEPFADGPRYSLAEFDQGEGRREATEARSCAGVARAISSRPSGVQPASSSCWPGAEARMNPSQLVVWLSNGEETSMT